MGGGDSREGEGKIKGQRRRGGFLINRTGSGEIWRGEGGKKNEKADPLEGGDGY